MIKVVIRCAKCGFHSVFIREPQGAKCARCGEQIK